MVCSVMWRMNECVIETSILQSNKHSWHMNEYVIEISILQCT